MSFYEAKQKAKAIIKNNLGESIVTYLLYSAALTLASMVFGVGGLLFGSLILMGFYACLIDASNTGRFKIEKLISEFKGEYFTTRILLSVIKNIYIFFWSLLFIIPGIVKSYSYMLSELIAMQRPDLSASECISESRRLMSGHKMNMFILDLSFIGWHILCLLSFGIGYLVLYPYIYQTKIEYIDANILPIKNIVIDAK